MRLTDWLSRSNRADIRRAYLFANVLGDISSSRILVVCSRVGAFFAIARLSVPATPFSSYYTMQMVTLVAKPTRGRRENERDETNEKKKKTRHTLVSQQALESIKKARRVCTLNYDARNCSPFYRLAHRDLGKNAHGRWRNCLADIYQCQRPWPARRPQLNLPDSEVERKM